MILRITPQQLAYLENEAKKTFPVEACALLFGKFSRKETTVDKIVVTSNTLRSATRFEIDTKVFYDAFTAADQAGLTFIGFFHSHPAPPDPSSVDLHFMRLWGDVAWLIFSTTENRFAAFRMENDRYCALILKT